MRVKEHKPWEDFKSLLCHLLACGLRQGSEMLQISNFLTSNREAIIWWLEELNLHIKCLARHTD